MRAFLRILFCFGLIIAFFQGIGWFFLFMDAAAGHGHVDSSATGLTFLLGLVLSAAAGGIEIVAAAIDDQTKALLSIRPPMPTEGGGTPATEAASDPLRRSMWPNPWG